MSDNKYCTCQCDCSYVPSTEEKKAIEREILFGRIKFIIISFFYLLFMWPYALFAYLFNKYNSTTDTLLKNKSSPIIVTVDTRGVMIPVGENPIDGGRWYRKENGASDEQIAAEDLIMKQRKSALLDNMNDKSAES